MSARIHATFPRLALACALACASAGAFAEKKALDDEELRGVSGKGISIAVNLQLNTRQIAGTAPPSNIAAGFNVNGVTTYAIVQNFGGGPHIAIAFPLRAGVTSSQFGRAIRSNSQSRVGRLLAGAPVELQNVLSGGGTSNDQTVSFARSGRYGLVCFVNEHNRLGMYRVVRVR